MKILIQNNIRKELFSTLYLIRFHAWNLLPWQDIRFIFMRGDEMFYIGQ